VVRYGSGVSDADVRANPGAAPVSARANRLLAMLPDGEYAQIAERWTERRRRPARVLLAGERRRSDAESYVGG
jgi:hypothetical protein